jgi:PmbA protein
MEGIFDDALAEAGEERKVALAMELERLTLSADPRIKRVRKCSYGEMDFLVHIRNSLGVDSGYRASSTSCSVSVLAEGDGDSQMGWDFGFSPYFAGLRIEEVARTAAANAVRLLGARKIPTMRCPAVLDNYVATEILEVLAPAFLAENVHKGKSLLAGKIGEALFSPLIRIRDDGTLSGGMATSPFDAEGVAHQNTVLAEGGGLVGYLYDSFHARRDGTRPTGNSVRSGVKGVPHLGITNLFIENGTVPPVELLRGIDRGLLITDVMGMHTANPVSGDFSVGAAGLLIENGAVSHPVKGVAIAGNILDLFLSIEAVGNDLRFFGAAGAPSLRIADLDVSGK